MHYQHYSECVGTTVTPPFTLASVAQPLMDTIKTYNGAYHASEMLC